MTDSVSGAVAMVRGNGSTFTGSGLTITGATNGNQTDANISGYIDLPNGLISSKTNLTVEIWAAPLSYKAQARLFDFGRTNLAANGGEITDGPTAPGNTTAADALYVNFCITSLNTQRMRARQNGALVAGVDSALATTAGTNYHYVFTFEDGVGASGASGGRITWYRNGTLVATADVNFRLSSLEDVNNWLGRSNFTADNLANAAYDEVRIYDHALTASEIVASHGKGPDPSVGVSLPVPQNRWSFNAAAGSVANGTAFADAGSGLPATVRGNGATLTGSTLVLPGTTTGNANAATIAAYLDFPNGFLSSRPSATYEIWLTPLSSKNWQRIFDFGRGNVTSGTNAQTGEIVDGAAAPGATTSYDGVMLSLNNGATLGNQRIEAVNDTAVTRADTVLSGTTAIGTEYHYALVIEDNAGVSGSSGSQARWYRNGVLQGSIDLAYHVSSLEDVNDWIGRSAFSGDSNSNFAIRELRVHSRALSAEELLSSVGAGPNPTFPPPVPGADSATIHPNQKVLINVLANDTGSPLASTLQIESAPSTGTATVTNGKILYQHAGSSAAPVTFTYRVGNIGGSTAVGTVTINFASSLRLTNTALKMPDAPPTNSWQLVEAFPGVTFNNPICISSIPGNTNRLFVCERIAKIKEIPDVTAATPTSRIFLDLQAAVAGRSPTETIEGGGNSEHGLLGLAFHPQYATNGYFYVAYTVRINGGSYYQRISRFSVNSSDPTVANPNSELILIQQLDEGSNHDGGDLHFGADGYLYYSAGDEENPNDTRLNSQKINKDFFSGIFRLDVDKKAGNLAPNAHAAIPTDSGVARFSVPIDNPFVHTSLGGSWDGTYNSVAVTPLSGVRTEFWATGLRHTWRFSFDSATGEMWGGDVGQGTYEEVNKIVKGGNYGWVYREGKHDTNFTSPAPPPKPAGFTSIDPIYEYVHSAIAGGDAQFKGNSICGGYVYRGTRFPALVGTYVFCDSVTGHVWQMNTTTGATVRLTGLGGAYGVFSTQGVDPSNKDLLFASYLTGKIMRLTTSDTVTGTFPTTLSATGLFADLTDLSPAPGLVPYEPNMAFWSDYAVKRRWFTIPDATSQMTWSKDGPWTFPSGMIFVKHFDLETTRGNPATKKRLETRVLVKTDAGSYGVSYRWNNAQTDATLVADAGAEFDVAINDNGTPHTQHWTIPSRTSCLTCHTPQAGHVLSFTTRQLNRESTTLGYTQNQLSLLSANGYFSNSPGNPTLLERHIRPDETAYPVEQRARSYLAVNCAYCHQSGGSASGFWDGRPEISLEATGLINGAAVNNGGDPQNKYIVPHSPDRSIVLSRMAASHGFTRMPPLATAELDQTNINLITDWIQSLESPRQLYEDWRAAYFSINDPLGLGTADPDGDGNTNYQEYLLGTNPLRADATSPLTLTGGTSNDEFTLSFTRKAFRRYDIQTSPDLVNWQHWDVPSNTNEYTTSDVLEEIDFTSSDPRLFFRLEISEP